MFIIVAVDKKTNVCLVNYLMNFYPRNVFPRKTHLIFMVVALDKKLNVYLMKEVAQCC